MGREVDHYEERNMKHSEQEKSLPEKLAKINKDRRYLMVLLSKLKKDISETNQSDKEHLDWLYKRRKDYRKRLTKLTNKKHQLLKEKYL